VPILLLAASATTVATGLGAIPVFFLYLLVETLRGLLAVSFAFAFAFAFAAGAMLALVATDRLPRTLQARTWRAVLGLLTGAAIMLALSAALGV
jgi:zinc transporter ZupT